ncbi:DUF268 domain-containing protein [Jiulongibacter sp. NS-SX5]|uniref:DUF268 domain-containing protein n=1 Tax=Jiulongibacter sp. NS-SX5 TaxID=3463854 RepID=UPI0040598F9C
MERVNKLLKFALSYLGIYPEEFFSNLKSLFPFLRERKLFKSEFRAKYPNWKFSYYPILKDKTDQSGSARGQYFYQDLYVASLIYKKSPVRHIDVGSRIDGFVAHLATFREVDVFDIRPLENKISNVNFIQRDLMKASEEFLEITDSLSCLHTIEHFGLGRYGDDIDIDGHLKGLDSLYSYLKPGGTFYFSTQIGPSRVEFNAHRVFGIEYLLELFAERYELLTFSYIDDNDQLHEDVALTDKMIQTNCGCKLGCGIFVLQKR